MIFENLHYIETNLKDQMKRIRYLQINIKRRQVHIHVCMRASVRVYEKERKLYILGTLYITTFAFKIQ